jgi:hypothetical protein
MSAIRRPAVLVASLAVLGGALTACGNGPSQVNSAVIIGDRVITVDDVQRRLDTALAAEPAAKDLAKNHKLDVVSRGIVNELVRHELLSEAAKRENLTVSEGDLREAVAGVAPSEDPLQRTVDAAFDANERARDQLLAAALGKKYLEKLQITFDGVSLSAGDARKTAEDLARQVAAKPDQAANLFAQAAGPQGQPINGITLSEVGAYGIYVQNQVMVAPLLGVPANSVVAFPLGTSQEGGGGGWLVAHIKERNTNATLSGDDSAAVSQVPPNWMALVGQHLASPLAEELGVRISPRYGVWDQLSVGVVPTEGEKVGLIIPVATQGS